MKHELHNDLFARVIKKRHKFFTTNNITSEIFFDVSNSSSKGGSSIEKYNARSREKIKICLSERFKERFNGFVEFGDQQIQLLKKLQVKQVEDSKEHYYITNNELQDINSLELYLEYKDDFDLLLRKSKVLNEKVMEIILFSKD